VGTAIRVALATAAYALFHSALASRRAKEVAARLPHGAEVYRFFFNAQAVVTFGALVAYVVTRPKRTVYHVRGPAAALMRLGQATGVGWAVAAARATGVPRLTGFDNVVALVRREPTYPPPAAQGPEVDEQSGELRVRGPFRLGRHPLNLAPLAPFWLTPHLTTRRLAFNVVGTLYLALGSLHEERRLTAAYGERYRRYQRSGVPFYVPRLAPPSFDGLPATTERTDAATRRRAGGDQRVRR
jgi:hypothetical protein